MLRSPRHNLAVEADESAAGLGEEGPLTARTAWLDRYQGLDLEGARKLADSERRQVRVIPASAAAITLDFRPERLNLWLKVDGTLQRLDGG